MTPLEWGLIYLALGAAVGFFAGMLGVGGGSIMVPLLVMIFDAQGLPHEHLVHLAVGTSIATILFTSMSSVRAHQRRGAIRWDVVLSFTPGILVGGLLGSSMASHVPAVVLAVAFAVVISASATLMILDRQPAPSRQLPGPTGRVAAGAALGAVSSLAAMGGGFASVPYMVWCNVPMRNAIGTAAALGFPIAVAGAIGYIFTGWHAPGLPPWSLGFVYLPAMASIAATSVLVAPLGALAAHSLPTPILKRVFAILLYVLAANLVYKVV